MNTNEHGKMNEQSKIGEKHVVARPTAFVRNFEGGFKYINLNI